MKQPNRQHQADESAPIRERWTALAGDGSDEALAGSLLRSAAAVRPFGAKEMAEVSALLCSKERFRPRPLVLQLAIALALILFGSALSAGVLQVLRRTPTPTVKPEPPATPPESSRRATPRSHWRAAPSASPTAPATGEPEQAPLLASALEAPAAHEPAPVRPAFAPSPPAPSVSRQSPVRTVAMREAKLPEKANAQAAHSLLEPAAALPPQPGVSALAKESRLLAGAIAELRQNGNAEQALATLDQHRREFGSGSPLSPEAKAARIEALVRLGRHSQALALLDAMALGTTGPQREMLVARAELRADKGRRAAALHDFDRLLSGSVKADAVTERARSGRANCRAQLGDTEGARSDLEAYIATFPEGRFAAEARKTLDHNNQ